MGVRALTPAEAGTVRRLAPSRAAPARAVERAGIVWLAPQGQRAPAIARELRVGEATVRRWLARFNARGVDGLRDAPRAGRPPTSTAAEVGAVVAASLTNPDDLGLLFGSWTLDRLTAYLREDTGLAISRSRIGEILQAEGRRWRTQAAWFGERVDPAFVKKRGPSSPSTRPRPRTVP